MRHATLTALAIVFCSMPSPPVGASDAAATGMEALQGTWIVSAAEQRGKPFDAIKGGSLTIKDDNFELQTAAGNRLSGKVKIDTTATPKQIDLLLSGGALWQGIYAVTATTLRLNYVEAGEGATRPGVFATDSEASGTVIVMRK